MRLHASLTLALTFVAATVPPGCEIDDNVPIGIPATCVVTPANPHHSGHAAGRINAVVAVKCAELREEVTVYVTLERRSSIRAWTEVAKNSKGPKTVKANNKLDQNANVLCLDGAYRTKGSASVKDDDGVIKRSDYQSSSEVQITCTYEEG